MTFRWIQERWNFGKCTKW